MEVVETHFGRLPLDREKQLEGKHTEADNRTTEEDTNTEEVRLVRVRFRAETAQLNGRA